MTPREIIARLAWVDKIDGDERAQQLNIGAVAAQGTDKAIRAMFADLTDFEPR